jgi:hypothetical protein
MPKSSTYLAFNKEDIERAKNSINDLIGELEYAVEAVEEGLDDIESLEDKNCLLLATIKIALDWFNRRAIYCLPAPIKSFEDTIRDTLIVYSILFWGKYARQKVLDHMFSGCGNGLDWKAGALTEDMPAREIVEKCLATEGVVEKSKAEAQERADKYGEDDISFYPLWESGAAVFTMPDDVRDDYLLGALEHLDFILSFKKPCFSGAGTSIDFPEAARKEYNAKHLAIIKKAKKKILERFSTRLKILEYK